MKRLGLTFAVIALAAVGFAGCGGGGDDTTSASTSATTTAQAGGGGGETVDVSADASGQLAFQQKSLQAKAGQATFDFDNPAQITHDFCLESSDGKSVGCSDQIANGKSTLDADLKPGKYTFYCSVDSHREAGMEGTLTVD